MSQQYPGTWKQCATCAYWLGVRETDYFGQRVTVESAMVKAKCGNLNGPWRKMDKQACSSCNRWEKWPVLK